MGVVAAAVAYVGGGIPGTVAGGAPTAGAPLPLPPRPLLPPLPPRPLPRPYADGAGCPVGGVYGEYAGGAYVAGVWT